MMLRRTLGCLAAVLAASQVRAAGPLQAIHRPAGSVLVRAGQSIQQAVDDHPPGTTFFLAAGEYRLQQVTPKSHDAFIGADGAVMNGARVLTTFTEESGLFVASGQAEAPGITRHGFCASAYPRCDDPHALFLDGIPLRAMAERARVTAGSWYFDHGTDRIYLADDPAGHQLELTYAPFAFCGTARDVRIVNLVVEKYASGNQQGAIGCNGQGTGWTVADSEVRWNYGWGIAMGASARALRNLIHHNGQLGIGGGMVDELLLEHNEISFNVWNGVDCEWECGGAKWGHVRHLTVRWNDVHENQGPGLWTDEDSSDVLYEDNKIENNSGAGISHEISQGAVIRRNLLRSNGTTGFAWGWHAQIQLQNAADVDVFQNYVMLNPVRGGNGITIIQQSRGPTHMSRNVFVHDNEVTMAGGSGAIAGRFVDYRLQAFEASGNRFQANRYHAFSFSAATRAWVDRQPRTFREWQAHGQDRDGTADFASSERP